MGYSAKAVANYFLSKYGKQGITPLKIQKLVYIAHGWTMGIRGKDAPLVDDEFAEAWEYGPVFPSIYHEFKHRGRQAILEPATDLNEDLEIVVPKVDQNDEETVNLLDRIWDVYGNYTGIQLSELCHEVDSPWYKARKESNVRMNQHISDENIAEHYREKLLQNRERRDDGS